MNKYTSANIKSIISQFRLKGNVVEIISCKTGHIHNSFHIVTEGKENPDYFLQHINNYVFKDVPGLMNNIRLVTDHLRKKNEQYPGKDVSREVLELASTKAGKDYYLDENGNYWRIYHYITDTFSFDKVRNIQQAFEGGKGYGKFLALLSDMDAGLLIETIPHFHDIKVRYQQLLDAVQHNPVNRLKDIAAETEFISSRVSKMSFISDLGQKNLLPLRITHNDTKFNNILLNTQNKAQCVIDLDTVMPGYIAYDFGDAVRTLISTAGEDEKDPDLKLNMELFEGFTDGFLSETSGFITDTEVESLVHGVLLLPYLMGMRFLTDYLNGDKYYRIDFPEHNLIRARNQLTLVAKLEENEKKLNSIIHTNHEQQKRFS